MQSGNSTVARFNPICRDCERARRPGWRSRARRGGGAGCGEGTIRRPPSESSEQIAKTYNENNDQKVVRSENSGISSLISVN